MDENTKNRLHDVFLYGLYMDPEILQSKDVQPRNPRKAVVADYELRIGNKATLLRAKGSESHGMVYALTHDELHTLYWGAGLVEYRSEAVLAKTQDGGVVALCCNLLEPPAADETNPEYAQKLKQSMTRLGIPITFK